MLATVSTLPATEPTRVSVVETTAPPESDAPPGLDPAAANDTAPVRRLANALVGGWRVACAEPELTTQKSPPVISVTGRPER